MLVLTFNIIKSKNCYEYYQLNYRIENCFKILKLMNENFIHFNERKKMCFDRKKQKDVKMHLIYELFKTKIAHVCLHQQIKI